MKSVLPVFGVHLVRERGVKYRRLVSTAGEAALVIRKLISQSSVEELALITIDATGRLIGASLIARGGAHSMKVEVAPILRAALMMGGSSFIIGHNHPSGDPTPSGEDITFTQKLAEAAALVGLPLLEHVIVTAEGGMSSVPFER